MNFQPINPYQLIKYLEQEVARLEKENKELKKELEANEVVD